MRAARAVHATPRGLVQLRFVHSGLAPRGRGRGRGSRHRSGAGLRRGGRRGRGDGHAGLRGRARCVRLVARAGLGGAWLGRAGRGGAGGCWAGRMGSCAIRLAGRSLWSRRGGGRRLGLRRLSGGGTTVRARARSVGARARFGVGFVSGGSAGQQLDVLGVRRRAARASCQLLRRWSGRRGGGGRGGRASRCRGRLLGRRRRGCRGSPTAGTRVVSVRGMCGGQSWRVGGARSSSR